MKTLSDFDKLLGDIAEYEWGEEIYRTENNGRLVLVWKEPESHEEYEFDENGKFLRKTP